MARKPRLESAAKKGVLFSAPDSRPPPDIGQASIPRLELSSRIGKFPFVSSIFASPDMVPIRREVCAEKAFSSNDGDAACILTRDVYDETMQQHFSDLGKLLIRLAAGGLMLFHGVSDILHGPGEVMKTFQSQGLPSFLAYGIYVGEFLAPLLILLGILARPAGILVAGTMTVAVLTAHKAQIFAIDDYGAWQIEVNAFYFLTALAVTCLGSGRWSVSRGRFPWD